MAVKTYQWTGGSGDVGVAGNWFDTTSGGFPIASSPPGGADIAFVNSGNLSGTGTANTYNFGGVETLTTVDLTATSLIQQNNGVLTLQPSGIFPSVMTTPFFQQMSGADLELPVNTTLNATGVLSSPTNGFLNGGAAWGTVNVNGGRINSGGQFQIGFGAANSAMIVSNAGTFNAWAAAVSSSTNYSGSLTVTGSGSAVNVLGGPVPGSTGTGGQVFVGTGYPYQTQNHGTVTVTNGAAFFATTFVIDGYGIGADGTVVINGGATFTNGSAVTGVLGNFGIGGSGGHGYASVSASGHLVEIGYLVAGGGDGGSGTLDVGPAGTVNVVFNNGGGVFAGGFNGTAPGTINVHGGGALLDSGAGFIIIGSGGAGQLAVSQGGTVNSGGSYLIGNAANASGSVTVDGASTLLKASLGVFVGNSSLGTLTVSNAGSVSTGQQVALGGAAGGNGSAVVAGGTITAAQNLDIGEVAGASGTLTISAGSVASATNLNAGLSGSGKLVMTGGTVSAGTLFAGYDAGAFGTIDVAGGTLVSASQFDLAASGLAMMTMEGGLVSLAGGFDAGQNNTAIGRLTATGGTLAATGAILIGDRGYGALGLAGGTISGAANLSVGDAAGGIGAVTVSSGLIAATGTVFVGNSGLASLNQSGGTASFGGAMIAANTPGSTGTITLTGGLLTASGAMVVGNSGLGSFQQSGGTTSFGGAITLGTNPYSLGTLNLANSLLATTANLTVGAFGAGVFTQASGTTSAGGAIVLGTSAGGSGAFTLAGGAVSASGSLVVGNSGSGSFTQTGGTTSLGGPLQIGLNSGASGVVALTNGLLFTANNITIGTNTGATGLVTVGSGGSLVGSKQILVGNNGDGQMTITAGGTVQTTMLPQTALFAIQIGNSSGSAGPANGAVLVSGAGALLTSNGNPASIGPSSSNGNIPGAGSLTVAQGGSAVFGTPDSNLFSALTIGKYGEGTVTVTDPGSTLTVNGFFSMGRGGTATLLVQNHGSVNIAQAPANGSGFGIGVGQSSSATTVGGNAQVYVESGGKIFMDGSFGNSIQVGGNGVNGALTVIGGTVESSYRMRIGLSVTLSGTLYGGSGLVTVGTGGTILADGTGITTAAVPGIVVGDGAGAIGEMDVRGASALASANGHTIRVGNIGVGHMNIGQAGTVLAGAAFAGDAAVEIGKTAGAQGFVDLTDSGSALTATGSLAIGDAGFGELSIAAGAKVSATAATLGVQAGGIGQAMVSGTGSTLNLSGALVVGGAGAGALSIATGGDVIATSITIGSAGAVNMLGGTLDPPSILNNGVITGFGFLDGPLVNAGKLIAGGGTLEIAGDVSGGGTLALGSGGLVLDGAVAPGTTITFTDGPGALTVSAPAGFAAAISGFAAGDTLSFLGVTAASYDAPSHTLSMITASGSVALPLVASTGAIHLSSTANGLLVAACFAEGTHLLTPEGRVPVETIRPGQMLCTAGGTAPVIWVGRRRLDLRRHRRPQDVMPIRVRAGAFAPGVPAQDVRLSPDHAVFTGGALVPIRYLTNGRTIAQERVDGITYWHVELPRHGVVLAEGLPCESYLDTGNRGAFEGGGPALDLHPDFARAVWAAAGCAPLVIAGPEVVAARAALLARAAALGHARTKDPGLAVMCGGRALPLCVSNDLIIASLPRGAERVRLRSRRFIPADSTADETDTRRLGVAIAAIWADGVAIPLGDPRLASGWHAAESGWRWTDGDAGLLVPGVRDLALRLATPGTYWEATRPLHRRAGR